MAGGKTVGAKGEATKPYLVPVFTCSNVSSLSLHLSVFHNTSGIGRLEFAFVD